MFKKAGCSGISFGIESLNDRILTLMKKGINTQLIERTLLEINGVLPVTIFMIVGFPTETEEEARQSFNKVLELKQKGLISDYVYSRFIVHSGSDNMEHPGKYGITKINHPGGEDLSPDIIDYECAGMSRETVGSLFIEFSQKEKPRSYPEEININGKTIRRRFDLREMMKFISIEAAKRPSIPFYRLITAPAAKIESIESNKGAYRI